MGKNYVHGLGAGVVGGQILEAGIKGGRRHWYSPLSFEGY
jgi:hypothetical protein